MIVISVSLCSHLQHEEGKAHTLHLVCSQTRMEMELESHSVVCRECMY